MWSSLVPAYSDAVGVCRTTSQVCFFARASRSACRAGSYLAMAWATTVSTAFAPHRCRRGAICWSTHPAASRERVWVRTATWRPFQAGTSQGGDAFPGLGEAVAQLEGVGDQLLGGGRGDTQCDGQGFGGVGRDLRAALATQRLVGQQRFAAPGGHAGLGGGGMDDGPLVGDEQLVACSLAFASVGVGEEVEQRLGAQVVEARVGVAASLMGLVKQGPPTVDRRRNPLFHRGSEQDGARWLARRHLVQPAVTARSARPPGRAARWRRAEQLAASAPKPPLPTGRGSQSRPPQASGAVP